MHGLIFETSIWLLAGSTRLLPSTLRVLTRSRSRGSHECDPARRGDPSSLDRNSRFLNQTTKFVTRTAPLVVGDQRLSPGVGASKRKPQNGSRLSGQISLPRALAPESLRLLVAPTSLGAPAKGRPGRFPGPTLGIPGLGAG